MKINMAENKQLLQDLVWPASRLGEAIKVLALKSGSSLGRLEIPALPQKLWSADNEALGRWLNVMAFRLGMEAETIMSSYAEVERTVRGAGPAIFRLPEYSKQGEPHFLALLKSNWRGVFVIGPDLALHRVDPEVIRSALCYHLEAAWVPATDQLLSGAGVPAERRVRARQAILGEQLGAVHIEVGWLLRLSPQTNILKQSQQNQLFKPLLLLFGAYIMQQLLRIVAWGVIGWAALQSHIDRGWLMVWALLIFTAIPFQLLITWAQNWLAINIGGLFKQRLLYGTLHLEPEEIRHQGAGQFLGRVMESEAVELLALGGGFMAVLALIELAIAALILLLGVGGALHALLLVGWLAVSLLIGGRYFQRNQTWVESYRLMTNDLVERMVGHRTRLAQEDHRHWHQGEDHTLTGYLNLSRRLDQIGVQLNTFMPRGWLILGLTGIAYTFITSPDSVPELAISLGGILLAYQAFTGLMTGIISIIEALQAWKQVTPVFQAAARSTNGPALELAQTVAPFQSQAIKKTEAPGGDPGVANKGQPILTATGLVFRYQNNRQPILEECNLRIQPGDRLLLEGPSGGGKSTLATLLAGLRRPEAGLLLLWGFDRQTMGVDEWRRRVVVAPQFHENHILTETFAFNLLMGRRWPPRPEDLAEAEAICHELGLADLLNRMPAGFQQLIGEGGWQLSHGERSRLYIARALLQQADLIILDESLGALDSKNLELTMVCILKRTPSLLVIGQP